jgi:hypothetical protein
VTVPPSKRHQKTLKQTVCGFFSNGPRKWNVYVGDFMPTVSRLSPRWKPTLMELANFDDNEGYVVGEGAVPPVRHTVQDCLF